jgi:hypothetical protein
MQHRSVRCRTQDRVSLRRPHAPVLGSGCWTHQRKNRACGSVHTRMSKGGRRLSPAGLCQLTFSNLDQSSSPTARRLVPAVRFAGQNDQEERPRISPRPSCCMMPALAAAGAAVSRFLHVLCILGRTCRRARGPRGCARLTICRPIDGLSGRRSSRNIDTCPA